MWLAFSYRSSVSSPLFVFQRSQVLLQSTSDILQTLSFRAIYIYLLSRTFPQLPQFALSSEISRLPIQLEILTTHIDMTSLCFRFTRLKLSQKTLLGTFAYGHTVCNLSTPHSASAIVRTSSVLEYPHSIQPKFSISHPLPRSQHDCPHKFASPSSSDCRPVTSSSFDFQRVVSEVVPHTEPSFPYLFTVDSLYMPLSILFRKFFPIIASDFRSIFLLHPLSIC